jgi:hypothetical protein
MSTALCNFFAHVKLWEANGMRISGESSRRMPYWLGKRVGVYYFCSAPAVTNVPDAPTFSDLLVTAHGDNGGQFCGDPVGYFSTHHAPVEARQRLPPETLRAWRPVHFCGDPKVYTEPQKQTEAVRTGRFKNLLPRVAMMNEASSLPLFTDLCQNLAPCARTAFLPV